MSVATWRSDNPLRPPDWRWNLAGSSIEEITVADIRNFRRRISECTDFNEHVSIYESFPRLYDAWTLYSGDNLKYEIEARILAGETPSDISKKTGIKAAVIAQYERCFFDVRSRLSNQSFILHKVICAVPKESENSEKDGLWKFVAYFGGTTCLEELIYGGGNLLKKSKNIDLALDKEIGSKLKGKIVSAIDGSNLQGTELSELLEIWYKIIHTDKGRKDEEEYELINIIKQNIGWQKENVNPSRFLSYKDLIDGN